ncbi:MAG: NADH-quinone oxidoreductase subunit NuoK [Deltaproteobacteria bacterium]|nr:NADH-quinone oxidoreductase subunit NuoK [Deltaproteobacteria bacterium]
MLSHYLILSAIVFAIGVFGVLLRRNAIIVMMSIELMLNAVNLGFVAVSNHLGVIDGQIFVIFIMAVAAAEAAVGLAIIIAVFRNYYSVETDEVSSLAL